MSKSPVGGRGPNGPARRRRVWGKVGGALGLFLAAATIAGLAELGTWQPLVVVMSPSMVPTLHVGDVALMQSLRGQAPHVGEIVEVPVPVKVQQAQHYPERVVHRVVSIKDGRLRTKGDNVGSPDPFDVPVSSVHRRLLRVAPGAGRLVGFLFSPFGLAWAVAGIVLFVVVPIVESSRDRAELEQVGLETIVALRDEVKELQAAILAPRPQPIDDGFERGIDGLRWFRDGHGHVRVRADHVTVDGFPLGRWLAAQRKAYRARALPRDRVARLEALGVRWSLEAIDHPNNRRTSRATTTSSRA